MKKNKTFRRLSALALTLILLLPLSGPMMVTPVNAAKVTQEQIDALKQDASSLASQKKDLQNQLKEIRADKSKALDQKENLEDQIDLIEAEIRNMDEQIARYDTLIGQKEEELAANEQERQELYELFCQRIRIMEEEGQTSYWAILFNSGSFSELLDNYIMIEEIIEYDNGVMESLLKLQEQMEADKADLEQSKA